MPTMPIYNYRFSDYLYHTFLNQILKIGSFYGKDRFKSVECLFPKCLQAFTTKKIHQFSCFKAIHKVSALHNYNNNVSGKLSSLYH